MAFDISKMDLTPVKVYWKPHSSTAEVYLGGTLGNCKISVGYEKADIKSDQTGVTVLDKRISGAKFMIETEIAQVNDINILGYIYPSASALSASALQWNNHMGTSDLLISGQLRIHPQNLADANDTGDWTFFVACPTEISERTYGPTTQSVYKVQWTVYPDTSTDPYRFARFGSSATA